MESKFTLSVARIGLIDEDPRRWHWSLKLSPHHTSYQCHDRNIDICLYPEHDDDPVIGPEDAKVYYYHAASGATWDGYEAKERISTSNSAAVDARAGHDIGDIDSTFPDVRSFILAHPCDNITVGWDCQDWIRSCVKGLYEAEIIQRDAYDGFVSWDKEVTGT